MVVLVWVLGIMDIDRAAVFLFSFFFPFLDKIDRTDNLNALMTTEHKQAVLRVFWGFEWLFYLASPSTKEKYGLAMWCFSLIYQGDQFRDRRFQA